MTCESERQREALSGVLAGAGGTRVVVLRSPAGAGLSAMLERLRDDAPENALILDDAQRQPAALRVALQRLRDDPDARLVAGCDLDDDHPARRSVDAALGGVEFEQVPLAAIGDERLTAMVRELAPATGGAIASALLERAGRRPASLRRLLALPAVGRRIAEERLLMHTEEIERLPVDDADALRPEWVALPAAQRELVVAVWLAGGRVWAASIREHLRKSGRGDAAAAPSPRPWVTEDDGVMWLGKRVRVLLQSLSPDGPLVASVGEALAGFAPSTGPPAPPVASPAATTRPRRKPKATRSTSAQTAKPKPGRAPAKQTAKSKPGAAQPKRSGANANTPAAGPAPTAASKPKPRMGDEELRVAARKAESRSDHAAAERLHRKRILALNAGSGRTSGRAFAARRDLAGYLRRAGDPKRAIDELASLVADVEAIRGERSAFACDILFEYGLRLLESGDDRGLERAREAQRRLADLGRAKLVAENERTLERAIRARRRNPRA